MVCKWEVGHTFVGGCQLNQISGTFICQAPETWLKYTTALLHLSAKALKVLLSFFAENLKNGPYFSRF